MGFQSINIRQIMQKAIEENGIIVDVRDEKRFREAHIPMAINYPLEVIEAEKLRLPKGRTILVYCDTGGASIVAARILSQQGYHVFDCVGGFKYYNGSFTK